MAPRKSFWQPPQLRTEHNSEEERRATWLELFFDLVFVVAIAELAHYLGKHLSLTGFLEFTLLFIPVWWCWVGATFYATRFDTDSLLDRLLAFTQMAIIAIIAVNIHGGLGSSVGYALSYAAFRGVIVLQYLHAGYHLPKARSLTTWYAIGFGASALLWVISIFIPAPWRFLIWGLGLIVDFATPLTAGRLVARIPPSVPHITERIGLFTIILLGEAIIGVVQGVAEQEWSPISIIKALLGLSIAFTFWWLYFDSVSNSPLEAMKTGNMTVALSWLYVHLPLGLGLAATGVGVEHIIGKTGEHIPSADERWLLCGAVAICLFVLAFLHYLASSFGERNSPKTLTFCRLGSAIFALILGLGGSSLSSFILMLLIALSCGIQVIFDFFKPNSFTSKPAS